MNRATWLSIILAGTVAFAGCGDDREGERQEAPPSAEGRPAGEGKQALIEETRSRIAAAGSALELYCLHLGAYPTADQGGLRALVRRPDYADEQKAEMWRGPYLSEEKIRDAWGNELRLTVAGDEAAGVVPRALHLWSAGPDGRDGTGDDIRGWQATLPEPQAPPAAKEPQAPPAAEEPQTRPAAEEAKQPELEVIDEPVHFFCEQCMKEFTIPRQEYYSALSEDDEDGRADCRLCGARRGAYPMTKCPKCGKYYLSARQKAIIDSMAEKGQLPRNIGQIPDRCPHCGTDRIEFLRRRTGT
jgi:hypothetical protein